MSNTQETKVIFWESVTWLKFKEGDQEAFGVLYQYYFSKLYNYGCKFTKEKQLVEDCIQNFFIKLWKNRKTVATPDSVKSYLFRSFRNSLIRDLQTQSKIINTEVDDNYNFEVSLSFEQELIDDQMLEENNKLMVKAFESLTKRQKEALFFKFYENLTYEQIAEAMQLELKSVYNLVSKAIETLRSFA